MDRRVVVTGVGIVSPLGIGTEETWKECIAGTPGVSQITKFDCKGFAVQIAGEVKGFDPAQYADPKDARRMARFSQLAVASAALAIEDARLGK